MRNLTAICDIKAGKAIFVKEKEFKQAIQCLSDGRYLVTFEKQRKIRSGQQNKTFWGIAYKIIQQGLIEAGHEEAGSIDFVHEICKENCLPLDYKEKLLSEPVESIVNKNTGEVIDLPNRLTTTKMSTVEAMEYYQNMQKFAAEFLGCYIPDPNEA